MKHWLVDGSWMEKWLKTRTNNRLNCWNVNLQYLPSNPLSKGDVLWFFGNTNKIIAMAIYEYACPLTQSTYPFPGWDTEWDTNWYTSWDTELHFSGFEVFTQDTTYLPRYPFAVPWKRGVYNGIAEYTDWHTSQPHPYLGIQYVNLREIYRNINRESFNVFAYRSDLNDDVLCKIRSFV